jgi:hypothetical protein
LEGKVISYKFGHRMVPKEKKIFHYDIFQCDGQRLFGVKLIDEKVIAKARATSKESRRKSIPTCLFCISRKKWIGIISTKL